MWTKDVINNDQVPSIEKILPSNLFIAQVEEDSVVIAGEETRDEDQYRRDVVSLSTVRTKIRQIFPNDMLTFDIADVSDMHGEYAASMFVTFEKKDERMTQKYYEENYSEKVEFFFNRYIRKNRVPNSIASPIDINNGSTKLSIVHYGSGYSVIEHQESWLDTNVPKEKRVSDLKSYCDQMAKYFSSEFSMPFTTNFSGGEYSWALIYVTSPELNTKMEKRPTV